MEGWGGWMIRPEMATGQHLDKSIQWYSTYVMAQIKHGGPGQNSSIPKPSLYFYYRDIWAGWKYCTAGVCITTIGRPIYFGLSQVFPLLYTICTPGPHLLIPPPPPLLPQKCQHVCKLSSVLLLGVVGGGGGEWLLPQIYQPKRILESGNANDVCCTSYFKPWILFQDGCVIGYTG